VVTKAKLPEIRKEVFTKARESLNEAEKECRIALAVIQAAQRRYDDAPIMIEPYTKETA
jgi:hypothetical protein